MSASALWRIKNSAGEVIFMSAVILFIMALSLSQMRPTTFDGPSSSGGQNHHVVARQTTPVESLSTVP